MGPCMGRAQATRLAGVPSQRAATVRRLTDAYTAGMRLPIGVELARAAKTVGREFERALAEAGGSVPAWLVLVSLKSGRPETQAQLAGAVGIEAATLTHHLNRL